jgi:tetratricopeptide (TPR) repeat protein
MVQKKFIYACFTGIILCSYLPAHASHQDPDSLYQVAMENYNNLEFVWSLEAFRQALVGYQQHGDLVMQAKTNARIAFNLRKLGKKDQATKYFEQSRNLFDSLGSTDKLYGFVLCKSGLHEQSNKVLSYHQSHSDALNWMALNYRLMGKPDSAMLYYQKAAKLSDRNPHWPYILIGNIHAEMEAYDSAIAYYNHAKTLIPDTFQVMKYRVATDLGEAYLGKGQYQKAIDYFLETPLPEKARTIEVATRNYELLDQASQQLKIQKIEQNITYLKLLGILFALLLVLFLVKQRKINNEVTAKLNDIYTKYLDQVLKRAIKDIDDHKANDAKKDIDLARELTKKLREN